MAEKKMTFEQAMTRLEEIVSQLENGEHTLEDALSLYEEGVKRMKQCVSMLDRAEQKVRKLRTDENGELFPLCQRSKSYGDHNATSSGSGAN